MLFVLAVRNHAPFAVLDAARIAPSRLSERRNADKCQQNQH